jgi:Protein of unknown function (DUF3089)
MTVRTRLLALSTLPVVACAHPSAKPSPIESSHYSNPASWLCLPGRTDACTVDLSATEIHPDGTRSIERFEAAAAPKADCFYVYPTVDLSLIPGNHDDFSSLEPMARTTTAQAARFRQSCALYVPLYRQVTIGTYLQRKESRERGLGVAFADVEASFSEYLERYNHGRPIVLLGHSQGAEMVVRLVRRFFDNDPAMRKRLLVAMAIGGELEAPSGTTVGGTFDNVPACTSETQTGCAIAYRSYAKELPVDPGRSAPKPGDDSLCTNPADLEHNTYRPFAATYIPITERARWFMKGVDGIETPFVMLKDFYAGQCVTGDAGFHYLAISLAAKPGDVRVNPVDFARMPFQKTLGLHVVDYQLPQGELLGLVAKRVAKLP